MQTHSMVDLLPDKKYAASSFTQVYRRSMPYLTDPTAVAEGCEKRRENTTPFGVDLTRSLVIYQAAQVL